MCNFAARCGAHVPDDLHRAFARCDSEEDRLLLATAIATEQADRLRAEGVGHLHVYTLNNPDLTFNICRALGFEAVPLSVAAGSIA